MIFGKKMSGRTTYIKENYVNKNTIIFDPCLINEYKNTVSNIYIYTVLSDDFIDRFIIKHKILQFKQKCKYKAICDTITTIIIDDLPVNDKLIEQIKILIKFKTNIVMTTIDYNIFNYFSINKSKIIYCIPNFIVYDISELYFGD